MSLLLKDLPWPGYAWVPSKNGAEAGSWHAHGDNLS